MKQLEFNLHKKEHDGQIYDGIGKEFGGHCKLKLQTFSWSHEHGWPLGCLQCLINETFKAMLSRVERKFCSEEKYYCLFLS